ncbi:hypothetical protein [Methylosarcina fibrata]|jgi:hypothetical protein|uniref:hypothetical protein n=1 Tax=Methylosarcina fibrata TaxID=105972 RepID=UPI00036B6071|nr:hypothetical protein [Methylosarcina fibrata]
MFAVKVKVGTNVRLVCEDALRDVTKNSLGQVVDLKKVGRYRSDLYVTIRWDNGCESFLNALFFVKTVAIVDEVFV